MFITRDLDKATIRGGQEEASRSTTSKASVRERAQAQGLSAPTGRAPIGSAQRAATAMRDRAFQSLGSGARALRKYACNSRGNWETVHTSDEMGRATTIAGIARRAWVEKW
eukprot:3538223-Pleurochrysis_carterae.AAC.2